MNAPNSTQGANTGPHDAYFASVQRALQADGIAWPCVVVDRGRLLRNVARLKSLVAPGTGLRLVEKSLPVPELLEQVMRAADTRRLMVFHEPQLRQVVQCFPEADLLMGKPMPVLAARHFYAQGNRGRFDPTRQLQWLLDTPQRLDEYAQLARSLGTTLRVSIEIDVGLHRGGVPDPRALRALLERLDASGGVLRFAGLMGYDAHVGKLPAIVERRPASFERSVRAYRAFQAAVHAHDPQLAATACWNGAGSPTVALHRYDSPLNDIAAGSLLLKPSAFDSDLLADFEPAVFIVAPVLKVLPGTRLPGPAWLSRLLYGGRRSRARSYFIYGGGWPADPVSPPGLKANRQFGVSFNQAIWNGAAHPELAVNDSIFFRPWQSEGTLLHYGPVRALEEGRVVAEWPPFGEG